MPSGRALTCGLWMKEWLPTTALGGVGKLVLLLIAVGQGVDVWVVDKGVVAVSPGELLGPDAKVVVRDKLGTSVFLTHAGESVDVAQDDDRHPHHDKHVPPHFPAVFGVAAGGHLPRHNWRVEALAHEQTGGTRENGRHLYFSVSLSCRSESSNISL